MNTSENKFYSQETNQKESELIYANEIISSDQHLNQDKEGNDKFARFESWIRENRTLVKKLELRDYGNEVRGCHSKEMIDEEEVIIEVPLKCLITVEMGKETEIGHKIISSRIELDAPKHIFLMIFMLVDRLKPNSFFKPYYDILPATLHNMPIFWQAHELKYLEGSYLLEQIEERNTAIKADYLAICNVVPEFNRIATLADFKWARMCVCSRNFGLVINGIQTAAMVPYADMLNHYRPRESKWQFDDSLQAFTVIALQKIEVGAQVFDSYGRKCNHRFLLNYGFSVENNIEYDGSCPNEVPIFVELKKSDPLYEVKCTFYRRDLSIPYRRIRVSISDNENIKTLLAMLRIMDADREDFDLLVSCSGNSLYRSMRDVQIPISIRNELVMLKSLIDICNLYLNQYPTTLTQDIERLLHGNIPAFTNERHALIQIRGEKEVLIYLKDLAETSLMLLQAQSIQQFDELLELVRISKHTLIYQHARSTLSRLHQDEMRRLEIRQRKVDLSKPTVV